MNEIMRVLHALMSSATITPIIITDSWFNFSWSLALEYLWKRQRSITISTSFQNYINGIHITLNIQIYCPLFSIHFKISVHFTVTAFAMYKLPKIYWTFVVLCIYLTISWNVLLVADWQESPITKLVSHFCGGKICPYWLLF